MAAPGSRLPRRFAPLFALVPLVAPLPAAAQLVAAGPEFAVSGQAVSVSPSPSLAGNHRGEAVVFWIGDCGDQGVGACARAYDAAGAARTGEVLLDLPLDTFQASPVAALGPTGRLLVVWLGLDPASLVPDLYARLFDRALQPLGGPVLVAASDFATRPTSPAVVALPGGGALVVWVELGADLFPRAIRGRYLDAAGNPGVASFQVDGDAPDFPDLPAVAADAAGRVVVAWDSNTFGPTLDDVRARVFDAAGNPLGDEFVVHQQSEGNQASPAVAAAPEGEFLVAWSSDSTLGGGRGIYGRRVSAAGALGVSETRVSPATAGIDSAPAAAGSAQGFAVAWQTEQGTSGTAWLRSLDLAGVGQGAAQPLASTLGFRDARPAIAADDVGNVFAAWNRRYPDFARRIFGRRFTAPPAGTCADDTYAICLGGDRFRVGIDWIDPFGNSGRARQHRLSADTAYFTFFSDDNAEVVLKVLNACGLPPFNNFWVFDTHLSNVEYTIDVRDTQTNQVRTVFNPEGYIAPAILGTDTIFTECGSGDGGGLPASQLVATTSLPPNAAPIVQESFDPSVIGPCTTGPNTLCLHGGRFRVRATFEDFQGGGGEAKQWALSTESGYSTFFYDGNVETFFKVHPACAEPWNNSWVFIGGLTNVPVEFYVDDTAFGKVYRVTNPSGRPFATLLDTDTFFTDCPVEGTGGAISPLDLLRRASSSAP